MTKLTLHGKLGKDIGEEWEFDISSIAESFKAIEANTKKFKEWILNHKDSFEYYILINGEQLIFDKDMNDFKNIQHSDLFINFKNDLKSIDIIPAIVGSGGGGGFFGIALGAIAIVASFFIPGGGILASALLMGGLGLVAAGVTSLLSKPPPLIPYNAQQANTMSQDEIGSSGGPTSYLFNGAVNTAGEGGPVPIGYGELIVGGHNVFTTTNVVYRAYVRQVNSADLNNLAVENEYLFTEYFTLLNQTSSDLGASA